MPRSSRFSLTTRDRDKTIRSRSTVRTVMPLSLGGTTYRKGFGAMSGRIPRPEHVRPPHILRIGNAGSRIGGPGRREEEVRKAVEVADDFRIDVRRAGKGHR